MKVIIAKDYAEASRLGADIIEKIVREKPDCCLGLATGSSPVGMYQELSRRCKEERNLLCHWETGKTDICHDAKSEELPVRNMSFDLRETGRDVRRLVIIFVIFRRVSRHWCILVGVPKASIALKDGFVFLYAMSVDGVTLR